MDVHPSKVSAGYCRALKFLALLSIPGVYVLEVVIHMLFWQEPFKQALFPNDPMEIWMRVLILLILIIACAVFLYLLKKIQIQNAYQESAYQALYAINEGVVITDANNCIVFVNKAFSAITGYALEEVRGKDPKFLKSGRQPASFYHGMWKELKEKGCWQGELWNRSKTGEVYSEWLSIVLLYAEDGSVQNHVAVITDVTARHKMEQTMLQYAYYDPLTELPNRRLLLDRLAHTLKIAKRRKESFAVLFFDLDGFKKINDTLGHDAGDSLLVEVGQRLQKCFRESDTLARIAGDEFVGILVAVDRQEAQRIGKRCLTILREPCTLAEGSIPIQASCGIAVYPEHADTPEGLMKKADEAMYQAKAKGKDGLAVSED